MGSPIAVESKRPSEREKNWEDVMKQNVTLALPSADTHALVTSTTNAIFHTDNFHD